MDKLQLIEKAAIRQRKNNQTAFIREWINAVWPCRPILGAKASGT